MISRRFTILGVATALAALTGCGKDDPTGPDGSDTVTMTLAGFPPFAQADATFELWISFALTEPGRHSAAASAGRFRIDGTGQVVGEDWQPTTFGVDPEDENVPTNASGEILWQLAVDAFVTLEVRDADDPAPRTVGLLGGSFLNGTSTMSASYADAFNRDFTTATGFAQLATPTSADSTDENEGVWFALPDGAGPSLSLPDAPVGWIYEGWISIPQVGPQSLGKFRSSGLPDSDGAGPLATSQPWPYPGSDFPFGITGQPLDLGSVFVTLEPADDEDGAGPFFLEILGAPIPASQPVNEIFALSNVADFPTGTVQIPFNP
ncbi:MAG: hypothetical protein KC591_13570 [Gemmatimonadetes bacterium]|nr:hypothetical protein [Gemmatimonadota bacterium]